jgi:hypothetical protein
MRDEGVSSSRVATPAGSLDEGATCGFRSTDRCAVGASSSNRLRLRADEGGEARSTGPRTVEASSQDACRRRAALPLLASSIVVSIQRWHRVTAGGNIGDPPSLGDRLCGANRVAGPWALRLGESSIHLGFDEPVLLLQPTRHSCRAGDEPLRRGVRRGASRDNRSLSERGEGRSRPAPEPWARPCSRCRARARRRGRFR